jgi:hypothetical protein
MKPNQDKSNSLKSTRKNIRFDNKLLSYIDTARGDKPFGTWVQETCSAAIKAELNESITPIMTNTNPVQTDNYNPVRTLKVNEAFKNDYATANRLPSNITEELHKQILDLNKIGLTTWEIASRVVVSKSSVLKTINASK